MVIFDGLKRQLRSVIQWQNPEPDVLFERWNHNGDEIKNASQLIVGPGQGCIFVYEGKVKSVLENECLIDLQTDNIPFWTTIKKFMQFFESEHKAAIYFFKRTKILDQKWGTNSPIKYEDPKYKFPVGLKAFGNFSYRIENPADFFINVIGQQPSFSSEDFRRIMSGRIVHPLSDYLAESSYSYAEIDANREEIAMGMQHKLLGDFQKLGFKITDFRIEGANFDTDTQNRINRIADITADVQAAKIAGLDYTHLQQLEAMRDAAKNETGGAGMGMGIGAGIGLGQNMLDGVTTGNVKQQTSQSTSLDKLTQLKKFYDAELISQEEYATKKQAILDSL